MAFALGFGCGMFAMLLLVLWWAASGHARSSCGCVRCTQARRRAVDPDNNSVSGLTAPPPGTHGAPAGDA